MGKGLKGKDLGVGICQRKDGLYTGRFVKRNGKTAQKYFKCSRGSFDRRSDSYSEESKAENQTT